MPLLRAHDRVAVRLVRMRADLWGRVRTAVGEALSSRTMRQDGPSCPSRRERPSRWPALYLGHPVPAASGPASPGELGLPFSHLGLESAVLVGADRDGSAEALRDLCASGPRISVAVATSVDQLLYRSSVELAGLLDEALARVRRRVCPRWPPCPRACRSW